MHIADPDVGNLGANAIVGGSTGIAAGATLSARMRGTDQVAVCFFGEGALGQGILYEAMNIASLWRLPVVYVCENNLYNEYTSVTQTTAGSMTALPEAFGIPCTEVDGQDVVAVLRAARAAVARARGGGGPSFLLCHTYRYRGHQVGDVNRSYRSREEEERWMTAHGMADAAVLTRIETDVRDEVARGLAFALEAPYPDTSEVDAHVYV